MDWFSEWFDSPYYHILYKNHDLQEAELFIDNLSSLLSLKKNQKIIDIPCGKGRHCIYLNKKGFDVSGADLSKESIQYASKFSNDTLNFFVHDMRQEFASNEYDLVLNIFTSFGYFESEQDDYKCIESFSKALKKGGKLVVDFMNADKVIANLVHEETKLIDGISFKLNRYIRDNKIIKEISFSDKGQNYHFTESVKIIHKEDFIKYFTFAGCSPKHIFGDYQLNVFEEKTSDRLILIAEKN